MIFWLLKDPVVHKASDCDSQSNLQGNVYIEFYIESTQLYSEV